MSLKKMLGCFTCSDEFATNNGQVGICTYTQFPNRAIISDLNPDEHGQYTLQAFNQTKPIGITGSIILELVNDMLPYAYNSGSPAVIDSHDHAPQIYDRAMAVYPNVQLFQPLGSNQPVLVETHMSCIIFVGAGANENTCGYGMGLEFFDTENIGHPDIQTSLTNGIIAGHLFTIKEALDCSWWESRLRARITATRTNITHPNGEIWNMYNGFGKIDTDLAIAYNGDLSYPDPFINNTNKYYPFLG